MNCKVSFINLKEGAMLLKGKFKELLRWDFVIDKGNCSIYGFI